MLNFDVNMFTISLECSSIVRFFFIFINGSSFVYIKVIFDRLVDHNIVRVRHAITEACLSALEVSGPILRSPIIGVDIHISNIVCGRVEQISNDSGCINGLGDLTLDKLSNAQLSSPSLLALLKTCCISSVKNAVAKIPNWHIMEPMMEIELQLPSLKGNSS